MKNSDKDNNKNLNSIEYIKEQKKIQKEKVEKLEKRLEKRLEPFNKFNKLVTSFKLPDNVRESIEQRSKWANNIVKTSQLSSFQQLKELSTFSENTRKIMYEQNKWANITQQLKELSTLSKSTNKIMNEQNKWANITQQLKELSTLCKSTNKIMNEQNKWANITQPSLLNSIQQLKALSTLSESTRKIMNEQNKWANIAQPSLLNSIQQLKALSTLSESTRKIMNEQNKWANIAKAPQISSFDQLSKTLESVAYSKDIIKILDEEIDDAASNDQDNPHSNEEIAISVDKILKESGVVDNLNGFIKEPNNKLDKLVESIEHIYEISERQPAIIKQIMSKLIKCILSLVYAISMNIMLSHPAVTELTTKFWGQENLIKETHIKKAYVKASNLNIRNDSSIKGIIVGKLKKNTVIQPITEVNGWILIEYTERGVPPTKEFGWVSKEFLTYF